MYINSFKKQTGQLFSQCIDLKFINTNQLLPYSLIIFSKVKETLEKLISPINHFPKKLAKSSFITS